MRLETAWIIIEGHLRFSNIDATGANFRGATLRGSRFYRANLKDADFTGADLRGASLEDTSLANAVFDDANLQVVWYSCLISIIITIKGAYLSDSIRDALSMTNVDFTDAQMPDFARRTLCSREDTAADVTRESLFCEWLELLLVYMSIE